MQEVYTRKQYMSDYDAVFANNPHIKTPFLELREETNRLHRKYYAQFVNQNTINTVVRFIGKIKLLSSEDEHLNDIPLKRWDDCPLILARSLKDAGDYLTAAIKICILKEAARQWIEANKV